MTIQITPPPNAAESSARVWKDWFSRLYIIIKELVENAAGGDVVGPASSTDNAIVLFDGVTGKLLQEGQLGNGLIMDTATTPPTLAVLGASGTGLTQAIPIACSDETSDLTTGLKVTFRMPYAMTLTAVRGSLTTAATGATLFQFDVNEGGTTIFSTEPTFDASEKTTTTAATPSVLSDTALADDAQMTVDIVAVGSTIAGAGLKVCLIGTKN